MPKTQVVKVKVARTMVPQVFGGQAVFVPGTPMDPTYPDVGQVLPGTNPWVSSEPEVGDKLTKEGYVELLSLNEVGYVPDPQTGIDGFANNQLKLNTCCSVQVSSQPKSAADLMEFRILYSGVTGEKLATAMAVVAGLKDAFINRSKVRVHAEARQLTAHRGMTPTQSDIYFAVQAVELLRT